MRESNALIHFDPREDASTFPSGTQPQMDQGASQDSGAL